MTALHNVAIIGAGIGAEHSNGYVALPNLYRVKTVCDLNVDRAISVAASCGAKVEIDFDQVLADPEILTTLPDNEYKAGLAEVIKHGIIADAELFSLVNSNNSSIILLYH